MRNYKSDYTQFRSFSKLCRHGARSAAGELDHRIVKNSISAVSLAAARSKNDEIKGALSEVAQLLHHYADVHRTLQMPEYDTPVDAAAYLRLLCLSISGSKLDRREIKLVLVAEPPWLTTNKCWRLGMIVHGLIHNAAERAFATGNGTIRIELTSKGVFVECEVQDNGSATASA